MLTWTDRANARLAELASLAKPASPPPSAVAIARALRYDDAVRRSKAFARADSCLNRAYDDLSLIDWVTADGHHCLRDAELAWIEYRDATARLAATQADDPVGAFDAYLMRATMARSSTLNQLRLDNDH